MCAPEPAPAPKHLRRRPPVLDVLPVLVSVCVDYIGMASLGPLLPYYLRDHCAVAPAEIAAWTGAITSSQFGGVVVGCLAWGVASDRLGPKRAVLLTTAGDAALFTASAFATDPATLLALRLLAGFSSPLVPALAYAFGRVDAVSASSYYAFAVVLGMALGNAMLPLGDGPVGWMGVACISGGLAAAALLYTLTMPDARRAAGGPAKGVSQALRSGNFVTQAASAFTFGFYFNGTQALVVVDLLERFGLAAGLVALVNFSIVGAFIITLLWSKALTRRLGGLQRSITVGTVLSIASCAAMALPPVHRSLGGVVACFACANMSLTLQHVPNQARAGMIGAHQTTNGTGAITGASRLAWACGQAAGPISLLGSYKALGVGAPWLLLAALQAAVLFGLYPACGVRLTGEPGWGERPRAEGAGPAAPVAAASVAPG